MHRRHTHSPCRPSRARTDARQRLPRKNGDTAAAHRATPFAFCPRPRPTCTMACRSTRPLIVYRHLLRTTQRVFAGDTGALVRAQAEIRQQFRASRSEPDAAVNVRKLYEAREAANFALESIIQAEVDTQGTAKRLVVREDHKDQHGNVELSHVDDLAKQMESTYGGCNPVEVALKKDRPYSWCSCGLSTKLPWCDGTHKTAGQGMKPVRFTPQASEMAIVCACGASTEPPYCTRPTETCDGKAAQA